MTVTTDRTQGGTSLVDGELEFMVHRRIQYDDHRYHTLTNPRTRLDPDDL